MGESADTARRTQGQVKRQAQTCPAQAAVRPVTTVAPRYQWDARERSELPFDNQRKKENQTNPGPGSPGPVNLITANATWRSCVTQNQLCMNPGMLQVWA